MPTLPCGCPRTCSRSRVHAVVVQLRSDRIGTVRAACRGRIPERSVRTCYMSYARSGPVALVTEPTG